MKILIIRFSSFGDVLQSLSIAGKLAMAHPGAEIHWVTRAEFAPLIETHPDVRRVWTIARGQSLRELWRLAVELRRQRFTHVYDAHNNVRSNIIAFAINGAFGWRRRWRGQRFVRRSKYRGRRFLLFRLRVNLYPKPFAGQSALLEPLAAWGIDATPPPTPQLFLRTGAVDQPRFADFVALAPSAAHPLKRWPLEHFKQLIALRPLDNFVVLGGPGDDFLAELVATAPGRVVNWAGRTSLIDSAAVVARARALVSNDTGLMHAAEQLGVRCVALMGPAPFGYPARTTTRVLERELWCRPCSKHGEGPCVNPEFQACLRTISPAEVARALGEILNA